MNAGWPKLAFAFTVCVVIHGVLLAGTRGPLRVHPVNPRYFADDSDPYTWAAQRMYLDGSAGYNISKRSAVFASIRNHKSEPEIIDYAGPSTPEAARHGSNTNYGAVWVVGVKGGAKSCEAIAGIIRRRGDRPLSTPVGQAARAPDAIHPDQAPAS